MHRIGKFGNALNSLTLLLQYALQFNLVSSSVIRRLLSCSIFIQYCYLKIYLNILILHPVLLSADCSVDFFVINSSFCYLVLTARLSAAAQLSVLLYVCILYNITVPLCIWLLLGVHCQD